MPYNEPQGARRSLFGSHQFSKQIAAATELDAGVVANACRALVAAGLIPCAAAENTDALATEGAMVLMAIGGRQAQPDAIVRVLARLDNMTHQVVVGKGTPGIQGGRERAPADLFAQGLSDVLKQTWQILREPAGGRIGAVNVSMLWGDERGGVLYGVIDHVTDHRKHVYSSATLPVPHGIADEWDFVQLHTVGGAIFSPQSILRFATLLEDSVAGTAAELDAQ